jgi:CHAD domain-containing protein
MHPIELSILLHRAVEARVGRILELTAAEGWLADPDAVHDVRVASRRLRAALDLADMEVYPGFRKHRRRAVRLTRALGGTRELDVHLAKLASLGSGLNLPGGHEILEHALEVFDRSRRKARRSMLARISRLDLADFRGLLAVEALPRPFESTGLHGAVNALLGPRIESALLPFDEELATEDPLALHQVRIQVKKLRYALEVLGAAFPEAPAAWLARLKLLQTALGEHHDWALLESGLWKLHAALTERQRPALASGTLDLLGEVVEQRRAAFEALRRVWAGPRLAEARLQLALPADGGA